MDHRTAAAALRQARHGDCNDCKLATIAHVCVRVSPDEVGSCLREPRYRRDPRLKSQGALLLPADWALLGGAALFQGVDEAFLAQILSKGRVRPLYRSETLFHQEDEAQSVFIVLTGWLKVYRTSRDGGVMIRRIVGAGDSLAEQSLLGEGRYPAAAEAVVDSRVMELPGRSLMDAITSNPQMARAATQLLLRRQERQTIELERAYWSSGPQRLAGFLSDMFPVAAREVDTRLPFDKNVLAGRLGMTPESLSRAFMVLRDQGVRTHNRCIYIEDNAQLRAFGAVDEG